MRNNCEINPKLLEELEKSAAVTENVLTKEQTERIQTLALEKLHAEQAAHSAKVTEFPGGKGVNKTKKATRGLRVGLIAAALACVGTVSVCAVAAQLPMVREKIGFFQNAPSQQQVQDPMHAPRGQYQGLQPDIEAFNALVGQSVTDNGVTLTLDSISMDVTGMDLFMTITGEEAIQQVLDEEDHTIGAALWGALSINCPNFWQATANGKETFAFNAVEREDCYLADDGSLKVWQHYMLTELPEGEQIEIDLKNVDEILEREGNWALPKIVLDGESIRDGGCMVEPVKVFAPYLDDTYVKREEVLENQHMEIAYFAFGPKGGVIRTKTESSILPNNVGESPLLGPETFMYQDDKGKDLFLSGAVNSGDFVTADISAPSEGATAITITPVKWVLSDDNGNSKYENRVVTSEEMRKGKNLDTNSLGGYTVQNYQVKNGSITFELVPYGYPGNIELIPQEDGKITMNNGHSGLYSTKTDPRTGIVQVRHDYYKATQEELESITEWNYGWFESKADTEHAITLPLQNVQP